MLLSAEIERVSGRDFSAQDLYERAVRYAGETGLFSEAVANELFGKFWLGRGRRKSPACFARLAPVMPVVRPPRSRTSIENMQACSVVEIRPKSSRVVARALKALTSRPQ
jgi:hypothetical protein